MNETLTRQDVFTAPKHGESAEFRNAREQLVYKIGNTLSEIKRRQDAGEPLENGAVIHKGLADETPGAYFDEDSGGHRVFDINFGKGHTVHIETAGVEAVVNNPNTPVRLAGFKETYTEDTYSDVSVMSDGSVTLDYVANGHDHQSNIHTADQVATIEHNFLTAVERQVVGQL